MMSAHAPSAERSRPASFSSGSPQSKPRSSRKRRTSQEPQHAQDRKRGPEQQPPASSARGATSSNSVPGQFPHSGGRLQTPPLTQQPLSDLHLLLHPSIPHLQMRAHLLQVSLERLGCEVTVAHPNGFMRGRPGEARPLTHVVTGAGRVVTPQQLLDLVQPSMERAPPGTPPLHPVAALSSSSSLRQRTPSPYRAAVSSSSIAGPRLPAPTDAGATSSHTGEACVSWKASAPPKIVDSTWIDAMVQTGVRMPSGPFLSPAQLFTQAADDGVANAESAAPMADGRSMDAWGQGSAPSSTASATSTPSTSTAAQQGLQLFRSHPLEDRSCMPARDATLRRFQRWLGYWHPWLDGANRLSELMMWPRYNIARSTALGNEPVVKLLMEMSKCEDALGTGEKASKLNGRALTYAHAAAAVRGCAFSITHQLSAKDISKTLPYCGSPYISGVVHDLVNSGTCALLEQFRSNKIAMHSNGDLRPGTEGAKTRCEFCRVPGVGPATAASAWAAGCRSLQDLENWLTSLMQQAVRGSSGVKAVDQGPVWEEEDGPGRIKSIRGVKEMLYCVKHRDDLLAPLPAEDVNEMKQALLTALTEVTGVEGWQLQMVGGGRRSKQCHDADFLATHKSHPVDNLATSVYQLLVSRGQLVPKEEGFCRMQEGRRAGYIDRARMNANTEFWTDKHQQDRYDHIFGLWITSAGKRRRMDVLFVPPSTWWPCLVGWTGSRQLMRFMRAHAAECGMSLNSHFLLRPNPKGAGLPAVLVPEEAPPLGRAAKEDGWPPGATWQGSGPKALTSEADLFALLGLPCWDVVDRNCPG